MITDVHAYWDHERMSLEELQRQMDQHGIDRVVLSAPCTIGFEPDKSPSMYAVQRLLLRNDLLRPVAKVVSQTFYDGEGRLHGFWRLFTRNSKPINKVTVPDNQSLLEAIDGVNGLYAWLWLNPVSLPRLRQIKEEIQHSKVVGLKLHAYWHRFNPNEARSVFALAQEADLPLYLILDFGWLPGVFRLLEEFPSVTVIFGYGGLPYFDGLWRGIRLFPNAYLDFTSFHIDERGITDAVRLLGSARCLYGSDCPYNFKGEGGRFNYSKTVDRIRGLCISSDEKELILHRNAQRLLFRKRPVTAPT